MSLLRTRPAWFAVLAALLASLVAVPAPAEAATGTRAADEVRLADLINRERTSRGLPALEVHLQLTRLARAHSAAMASRVPAAGRCGGANMLFHRSPLDAGVTADWSRLRENVGCNLPANVDGVHQALMNSSGHRANILASDVTFVGVGVRHSSDGGLWVTEIFMRGGMRPQVAPVHEGIAAAKAAFGSTRPSFVVLSRSDVFADSLGGAALAGGRAPILFTDAPNREESDPVLRPRTRAAIDDLLGGRGRVYLLGGVQALGNRVANELGQDGYEIVRLHGPSRIETAVAIANEVVKVYGAPATISLASAVDWPDAITGGSAAARQGDPLVLTYPRSLPSATAAFLGRHPRAARVALGGTTAVSDGVARQAGASRLAGPTRAETALAVADGLFGGADDEIVVVHGWAGDGWGRALSWSSYAARNGAPQVLVADTAPPSVISWLEDLDGVTARFASGVPATARAQVQAALGR